MTALTIHRFRKVKRSFAGIAIIIPMLIATSTYGSPISNPYAPDNILMPDSTAFQAFNDFLDTAKDLSSDAKDIYDGFGPSDPTDGPPEASLGTLCLSDEACKACAGESAVHANRAFEVLVNNERLLARTLRKAKMYETAADGAASQHAAAKAAYAIQQATQIEPAKRKFFKNIGTAQDDALKLLDRKLQHLGQCELEHMGTATFMALGAHTHQLAKIRFKISAPED